MIAVSMRTIAEWDGCLECETVGRSRNWIKLGEEWQCKVAENNEERDMEVEELWNLTRARATVLSLSQPLKETAAITSHTVTQARQATMIMIMIMIITSDVVPSLARPQ